MDSNLATRGPMKNISMQQSTGNTSQTFFQPSRTTTSSRQWREKHVVLTVAGRSRRWSAWSFFKANMRRRTGGLSDTSTDHLGQHLDKQAMEEGIWQGRNGTWARFKLRDVLAPVPSLHSPLPFPSLPLSTNTHKRPQSCEEQEMKAQALVSECLGFSPASI